MITLFQAQIFLLYGPGEIYLCLRIFDFLYLKKLHIIIYFIDSGMTGIYNANVEGINFFIS